MVEITDYSSISFSGTRWGEKKPKVTSFTLNGKGLKLLPVRHVLPHRVGEGNPRYRRAARPGGH